MINDYRFRADLRRHSLNAVRRGARPALWLLGGALIFTSLGWELMVGNQHQAIPTELPAATAESGAVEIPLALPNTLLGQKTTGLPSPTVSANTTARAFGDAGSSGKPTEPLSLPPTTSSKSGDTGTHLPAITTRIGKQPASGTAPAEATAPSVATVTESVVPVVAEEPEHPASKWHEEKIRSGDSLSKIFSRLGLSANLLHRIINSSKEAKQLARIRPGETIRVQLDDEGRFLGLIHQRSPIRSLEIVPNGEEFEVRKVERGLETRTAQVTGTITNSLYRAAQRAGLSDRLTMELADIFGWDVDFALEIRAGDSFSLIYEERYLDNEKYANGDILAAEFVNQGNRFRAVRYEDKTGRANYYSPDGHSMRKAFLRAPVDFRRISSRFTKARWHPVLGKKRPHKGVDYSAAIGTPIKASGDGRIIFRGRKGGYGNAVIIQHGSQYTTLYGHMSKFNRKAKQGSRVQQGQIIGYVGKTGLATGPHLHYEFRVNGVHRNPLKVKLPGAAPIAKKHRQDFAKKTAPLVRQLDLIGQTILADAQ